MPRGTCRRASGPGNPQCSPLGQLRPPGHSSINGGGAPSWGGGRGQKAGPPLLGWVGGFAGTKKQRILGPPPPPAPPPPQPGAKKIKPPPPPRWRRCLFFAPPVPASTGKQRLFALTSSQAGRLMNGGQFFEEAPYERSRTPEFLFGSPRCPAAANSAANDSGRARAGPGPRFDKRPSKSAGRLVRQLQFDLTTMRRPPGKPARRRGLVKVGGFSPRLMPSPLPT